MNERNTIHRERLIHRGRRIGDDETLSDWEYRCGSEGLECEYCHGEDWLTMYDHTSSDEGIIESLEYETIQTPDGETMCPRCLDLQMGLLRRQQLERADTVPAVVETTESKE